MSAAQEFYFFIDVYLFWFCSLGFIPPHKITFMNLKAARKERGCVGLHARFGGPTGKGEFLHQLLSMML